MGIGTMFLSGKRTFIDPCWSCGAFNETPSLQSLNAQQNNIFFFFFFFNTIFVSSHMYPENPEGTQVIVGSMNMGYISDTARNRTHNLFRPKREPIPQGHSDGPSYACSHSTKPLEMIGRSTYILACSRGAAPDSDINQTAGSGGHPSMWKKSMCAGQPKRAGDAAESWEFLGEFSWVQFDPMGVRGLLFIIFHYQQTIYQIISITT